MRDLKDIVRRGYDRISHRYRDDQGLGEDSKDMIPWLRAIDKRLSKDSQVLELGCGMGIPVARSIARRHHYFGLDISGVQIKRAKKLVPKGFFKRADMSRVQFIPSSFDAVLSFYAIIHLPLKEQRPLFRRVFRWLKPGGMFVAVLGHGRWTGRQKNWHGAEMFWSHTDRATYRRWLQEAGFRVRGEKFVKEGKVGHNLFFCEKPDLS